MRLTCIAGAAWKQWAQERTGRSRERHARGAETPSPLASLSRAPGSFLHPLLPSTGYAGYHDVIEANLSPRLLV